MNSYTDTALRQEGMKVLFEKFGKVDAERFIALIIREPFDYTQWQQGLFPDMSVEELSAEAMAYYKHNNPPQE